MASWAKMASNLDSHPKIRKAGREGREVFLFVLRRNAELDLNGLIPKIHLEPWYVAYELMVDEVTASNGLSRAVTAGLLIEKDTCFAISGWNDEWAKRPLTTAERQERYREKQKGVRGIISDAGVTVTESNEPVVTKRDSNGSEESRGEEKRVEERREDHQPAKPARRGSIPEAWRPSPTETLLAAELGLDCDHEAREFHSFWSGDGRPKKNWDQTFRNRLLTQGKRKTQRPKTPLEQQLERVRMLEEQERQEASRDQG